MIDLSGLNPADIDEVFKRGDLLMRRRVIAQTKQQGASHHPLFDPVSWQALLDKFDADLAAYNATAKDPITAP
jgi:hypothetical protein